MWKNLSLFSCFYFLLVSEYLFSFNYEVTKHYQYYLLPVVTGILLFDLLLQLCIPHLPFSRVAVALLLALLPWLGCLCYSVFYNAANEHLTIVMSLVSFCVVLLLAGLPVMRFVWLVVAIAYVLQIGYGAYRYFGNLSDFFSGSLQNPGIYACYVVIHLPLVWYILRGRVFIWSLFLLITLFIVYIDRSRTAFLAMIPVVLLIVAHYLPALRKRALLYLCVGVLLIAGYRQISDGKERSATGRVVMLEVTKAAEHVPLWSGTGLGRFTWYYPQWQAAYFETHPHVPQAYQLSAGESFLAFNEYIQLFRETGVAGVLLFAGALCWFFSRPDSGNQATVNMLKQTMVAILACAFTSYPLHVTVIIFLMLLCFTHMLLLQPLSSLRIQYKYLLITPVFILLIVVFGYSLQLARASRQWSALEDDDLDIPSRIAGYRQLYPVFKRDGKFLTMYGETLMADSASLQEAAGVLARSESYFISYRNCDAAATAAVRAGQYMQAINNYTFLAAYLPSRFTPRYKLARLYLQMKDSLSATRMASAILAMPVKIPSPETEMIRKEMRLMLSQH